MHAKKYLEEYEKRLKAFHFILVCLVLYDNGNKKLGQMTFRVIGVFCFTFFFFAKKSFRQ